MSRKASGLKAWVAQRVSAIYIGAFLIYLIVSLLLASPADYAAWRDWFTAPVMSIATWLFGLAVLLHAWIGVRDVAIDYLWNTAVRVAVLTLVALLLLACALWLSQILILVRLV